MLVTPGSERVYKNTCYKECLEKGALEVGPI